MPHGRWMRTLAGLILASSLLAPRAYAQSPVVPVAAAPSGLVQVGVAGAVQGPVQISSGPTVGMVVESGRPIYLGDVVTTGAEGRLQVLLLDETVFTVGPNSSIVIDEFVYDPATSDGKITAQVLKGAFRFVTGKIAHKKPENMKVTLPSGTIGVRGTMVAGRVEGQSSLVALLGPGPDNNVGARIGRIEVSNPVEGQLASVMVTQPGFGTTIPGANMPPTPPALVPPQIMQALQHDLAAPVAPPQPMPDEDKPAAPQNNSESTDESKPRSGGPQGPHRPDGNKPENGEQPNGPPSPNAARPAGPQGAGWHSTNPNGPPTFANFNPFVAAGTPPHDPATTAAQTPTTVQNGIAAREQLTQIQTGEAHWQGTGPFVQNMMNGTVVNKPGTMQVKVNINFGNRTIGGGLSHVQANTTAGGGNIAVSMPINAQSFNNAGPAMFHQTSTPGTFNFDYAVQNVNGVVGQGLGVQGRYESTDHLNKGEGAFNMPRQDGPLQ